MVLKKMNFIRKSGIMVIRQEKNHPSLATGGLV